MKDRTSYSYRGDTPGPKPDMYSQGGKAREAFKQARCSPYIRQEAQQQNQGSSAPSKEQFKAKRSAPAPTLKPSRSR